MTNNALITGNSSGLGLALTELFLDDGWNLYGLSRRGYPQANSHLHDIQCNLGDRQSIPGKLNELLDGVSQLELVILNAGILGQIKDLSATSLDVLDNLMQINVWSNKIMLDWLLQSNISIRQIILISSGASVNGNRGWGGYSLSKAALNMLAKLYAHEFPGSHLSALAPGLVDTAMQSYLCDESQVDAKQFSSVQHLRNARGTPAMPSSTVTAKLIIKALPELKKLASGSYADLRTMKLE